jgi:site-specific DNA recombinase
MTRRAKPKTPAKVDGRRCGIYTRKSTAAGLEQEFNTLEAQYEACQRYIAGQPGWRIVPRRYDDGGFTGANLDRPAFRRLLADIDAGEIDIVVVYKVDRLSRSLLDFAQVMDRFNRAGAAFVSVTQNFSTADAIGRLTLHMLMSFAEFERSMISERTRDKVHAARRKWKWTGGVVPLGYTLVEGRLVVDEVEAVVVREIFSLYEQHHSAVAVASLLNGQGRTTKHHRANNGHVRRSSPWTKNTVLHTLRNPLYAGYMTCGPEELNEGEHDAIIDRQRWHAMRERLGHGQAGNKTFARNPEYLLRGILKCGACGKAMTPATARGRKGVPYRYYRCVTRDKQGAKACTGKQLSAPAIEAFIVERLREAIAAGDFVAEVHERLTEWKTTRRADLETERKAIRIKIKALSKEGNSLVDALTQTEGKARRLLEEKMADVGEQLSVHEARQQEIDHVLASLDKAVLETQWVADILSNFEAVWEAMTIENRGRLMRAVVEKVEVNEETGLVTAVLVDLSPEVTPRKPEGRTTRKGKDE